MNVAVADGGTSEFNRTGLLEAMYVTILCTFHKTKTLQTEGTLLHQYTNFPRFLVNLTDCKLINFDLNQ